MFDLGFWEIMMIVLIALVVVGPERLPGLARTAGLWVGKAKRFVNNVKAEINQELAAEELKGVIDKQSIVQNVRDVFEETKQATDEIKKDFRETVDLASQPEADAAEVSATKEVKPQPESIEPPAADNKTS